MYIANCPITHIPTIFSQENPIKDGGSNGKDE